MACLSEAMNYRYMPWQLEDKMSVKQFRFFMEFYHLRSENQNVFLSKDREKNIARVLGGEA